MSLITAELLREKLPKCKDGKLWADALNKVLPEFDITSTRRVAAFIAQTGVESASFNRLDENLVYTSAARLMQVWPRRFRSVTDFSVFLRNPVNLGNFVYANRLGNGDVRSGDGFRFRGRGLLQITGRKNYLDVGKAMGLQLNEKPDLLMEPVYAVMSAAYFWRKHHLNSLADSKSGYSLERDFVRMTRIINGGKHALAERQALYSRLSLALGA